MPFPSQTLTNDLKDWSVSLSMKGGYSATVNLTNQIGQYGYSNVWQPFQISLDSALGSASDVTPSTTPYVGTTTWVYGVINSVELNDAIAERMATFSIRSFYGRMSERPVNTYFYNAAAPTVFTEVAEVFAAVPSALVDVTLNNRLIYGVVGGNNVLDELKKVAQAGNGEMYVPRNGKLTAKLWKDASSSVDQVIPPTAIIDASITVDDSVPATRIVVRGRFISQYEAGICVLTGGATERYLPGGDGEGNTTQTGVGRGAVTRCTKASPVDPSRIIAVGRLKGYDADQLNATYSEQTGLQIVDISPAFFAAGSERRQGSVVSLKNADGSVIYANDAQYILLAQGRIKDINETLTTKQKALANSLKGNLLTSHAVASQLTGSYGASAPVGLGSSSERQHDEQDPNRMEMILNDLPRQAIYGVIYEQIDNPYASEYDNLYAIARRRFQEIRMQKKAWRVRLKYVTTLDIGQVVTFTDPKTGVTVTGLLSDLSLKYSADPKADMEITVLSFEDIGATTYYSGNLLVYPNMIGYNQINWAVSNASPDNFVRMFHGYAGMSSSGTPITLSQTIEVENGATYSFLFSVAFESGASITVSVGGTSSSYSSTTTDTLVYSPTVDTSLTVSFTLSGPSVWYVYNLLLWKSSLG